MENHDKILEVVGEIAPGIIGKRWDHRKGACIASTAVGLLVLEHFGIEAEPLCVEMIVGNAAFGKWCDAGMPPFASRAEAEASGVRYLAIDTKGQRVDPRGIDAHVVIGMRSRLEILDLSFGQFNRPKKNILVEPSALLHTPPGFWTKGFECRYQQGVNDSGVVVLMKMQDDPPDYARTPDWNKTHDHHEIAKKIIGGVARRLASATRASGVPPVLPGEPRKIRS